MEHIVVLIVVVVVGMVVGPWARRYGRAYRERREQMRGPGQRGNEDL